MANYDTFADLMADVSDRAGQKSGDEFDALVSRMLVRCYDEILGHHPWLWLRTWPPSVISTKAPLIGSDPSNVPLFTISVANGLNTATFNVGLLTQLNRKIIIAGFTEYYRIAAHQNNQQALTLDAPYNGPTNTAADFTIFTDEYTVPANMIIDGMYHSESRLPIEPKSEDWIREYYPDPPRPLWPPRYFARISDTKIRFEGYPTVARRLELTGSADTGGVGTDISDGTTPILIPRQRRYVLADGALMWLWTTLDDLRKQDAATLYAAGLLAMVTDDNSKRIKPSGIPRRPSPGPYS